jgi:hypothetical protein
MEAGAAFRERVTQADGDVLRCADLMAEAIAMWKASNGVEPVGKDGRSMVSMEELEACYCADAARSAYVKARGSNAP